MSRYFFDYLSSDDTLRDYEGRLFRTIRAAYEHADLIAIHLQYDPDCAYSGWSIVVRDALGAKIYDVPVPPPEPGSNVVLI